MPPVRPNAYSLLFQRIGLAEANAESTYYDRGRVPNSTKTAQRLYLRNPLGVDVGFSFRSSS